MLLVLAVPLLAELATGYELGWDVLSGGGGTRGSENVQIDDVLGQWPDGRARSAQYQVDPGFWTAGRVRERRGIFLPLIRNTRS
jgi:hypothetical protein